MFPHKLTDSRAFDMAQAHATASTATTGCSARPAPAPSSASSRPTGTASSARSASASSSTTSASTRRWTGCAASSTSTAVDGQLAAGQAALHRPAHRPPPARAGRDLLQLGHRQAAAPQLLPQRLHLRAAGGQHRVHRERRAGRHAHLPRLLPDARDAARDLGAHRRQLPAAARVRGPGPRRRARAAGHAPREWARFRLRANFQIQVLSSLFYRNKGAYMVGKIINGFTEIADVPADPARARAASW
jgi:hypothetical protein